MSTKKFAYNLIITTIIAGMLFAAGCKKDNDTQADESQKKIDAAVDSVRLAVETDIGKIVPTLNVFIETPEGSWFSSSAGQGYQPITPDTYFRFEPALCSGFGCLEYSLQRRNHHQNAASAQRRSLRCR
jgi:hypothetical protein